MEGYKAPNLICADHLPRPLQNVPTTTRIGFFFLGGERQSLQSADYVWLALWTFNVRFGDFFDKDGTVVNAKKKRNWSKEYTAQQQVGETFEEARAQTVQRDNKKILNDPVSWNPARITKPVQDNHFPLLYTPCAGCLPPLLCWNVLFTRSGNAGNFCFPSNFHHRHFRFYFVSVSQNPGRWFVIWKRPKQLVNIVAVDGRWGGSLCFSLSGEAVKEKEI